MTKNNILFILTAFVSFAAVGTGKKYGKMEIDEDDKSSITLVVVPNTNPSTAPAHHAFIGEIVEDIAQAAEKVALAKLVKPAVVVQEPDAPSVSEEVQLELKACYGIAKKYEKNLALVATARINGRSSDIEKALLAYSQYEAAIYSFFQCSDLATRYRAALKHTAGEDIVPHVAYNIAVRRVLNNMLNNGHAPFRYGKESIEDLYCHILQDTDYFAVNLHDPKILSTGMEKARLAVIEKQYNKKTSSAKEESKNNKKPGFMTSVKNAFTKKTPSEAQSLKIAKPHLTLETTSQQLTKSQSCMEKPDSSSDEE
ncbi:MAG: hypothetical protein WC707_04400 [Candidatus Babeliaceae bacterium]|jgi:hypothetical protein